MIVNFETNKLVYERDYTDCKFGLLRDNEKPSSGKPSNTLPLSDSASITNLICNLIKLQEGAFGKSSSTPCLKIFGFTELHVECLTKFTLAIAIFYKNIESELIQDIASKLLNTFVEKFESKTLSSEVGPSDFPLADKFFLPIYEDLLIQSIKYFILDLSNLNLYVPWIYICLLAQPKVPLIADSFPNSQFIPMDSISANKAKIM